MEERKGSAGLVVSCISQQSGQERPHRNGDLGARPEEERERATEYLGSVLAERAACVKALR